MRAEIEHWSMQGLLRRNVRKIPRQAWLREAVWFLRKRCECSLRCFLYFSCIGRLVVSSKIGSISLIELTFEILMICGADFYIHEVFRRWRLQRCWRRTRWRWWRWRRLRRRLLWRLLRGKYFDLHATFHVLRCMCRVIDTSPPTRLLQYHDILTIAASSDDHLMIYNYIHI